MRRVPELRQTVGRMQREQQQRQQLLLLAMVVLRRLRGAETAETPRRLQAPAAAEAAPACRQQLLPLLAWLPLLPVALQGLHTAVRSWLRCQPPPSMRQPPPPLAMLLVRLPSTDTTYISVGLRRSRFPRASCPKSMTVPRPRSSFRACAMVSEPAAAIRERAGAKRCQSGRAHGGRACACGAGVSGSVQEQVFLLCRMLLFHACLAAKLGTTVYTWYMYLYGTL